MPRSCPRACPRLRRPDPCENCRPTQADAASAATAATAATAAAARDPLASKQQSYLRRGACQLLRASHPPAIGTALHTFGPGFARWVKWASLRLYEVPYGEDVPLWAALRQVSRIRDAGVRDSAASEAAIEDADVVLRLEVRGWRWTGLGG